MNPRLRPRLVAVAIAVWAVGVCGAVFAYTSHATEAAPDAAAPATWPAEAPLERDSARKTLILLVHPMCPCSRAALRELERILARSGDRVTARVVFMRPLRTGDDPRTSFLWNEAASIPGVTASVDEQGAVARVFGAGTSGQTMLYGIDGDLLFAGGITQPGGHEGDNAGRDAVEALILGDPHSKPARGHARASLFGCPLFF